MKLKKILTSSKGLTLIEVLASLTILSIILLGSMNYFHQAYSYTSKNQSKTAGINVARNALMYLQNESYIKVREVFKNSPTDGWNLYICSNEYKLSLSEKADCDNITVNDIEFKVNITAPKYDANVENFYFPVTVNVKWDDGETSLEGVVKSEGI